MTSLFSTEKRHIRPHSRQMCEAINFDMGGWYAAIFLHQASQAVSICSLASTSYQCQWDVPCMMVRYAKTPSKSDIHHVSLWCFTLQSSKKYLYKWWRWAWLASIKNKWIYWILSPKKHVYSQNWRLKICKMSPFATMCLACITYFILQYIYSQRKFK